MYQAAGIEEIRWETRGESMKQTVSFICVPKPRGLFICVPNASGVGNEKRIQ